MLRARADDHTRASEDARPYARCDLVGRGDLWSPANPAPRKPGARKPRMPTRLGCGTPWAASPTNRTGGMMFVGVAAYGDPPDVRDPASPSQVRGTNLEQSRNQTNNMIV